MSAARSKAIERQTANLDIAMPLEIEHRKTTDVPDTVDVDCKLPEKVDDGRGAPWKRVPEDNGGKDHREDLAKENGDLHREELAEIVVDLGERDCSVKGIELTIRKVEKEGRSWPTCCECSLPFHSSGR